MAIVGPGAVVENELNPLPALAGLGADYIVTLHNPLSDDFVIQVGQTAPMPVEYQFRDPLTKGQTTLSEADVNRTYAVNLRNPDHQSKKHFINRVMIPAGGTKRFTGDVAQVAVRQILSELMQREGKETFLADPVQRSIYEQRIIVDVKSQAEFMGGELPTPTQQVQHAVYQSNEVTDEKTFPGFDEAGASDITPSEGTTEAGEKNAGRTKASGK